MSDAYGGRPAVPDISQLAPANGRVGVPASGTYGEKAALAELEGSLPPPTVAQEQGGAPLPGGGGPLPLPGPSGALPRSIAAPSTRPMEPMSTPLAQPMPIGETPSAQLRQQIEAWARDSSKSETFRAWAQSMLDRLAQQ